MRGDAADGGQRSKRGATCQSVVTLVISPLIPSSAKQVKTDIPERHCTQRLVDGIGMHAFEGDQPRRGGAVISASTMTKDSAVTRGGVRMRKRGAERKKTQAGEALNTAPR